MENLEQRNILLSDFVEARSREINYLHTSLEKKLTNSTKQCFQQLPKHMRRRAMSHNRYRVPSRIRHFYDKEKSKTPQREIKQVFYQKSDDF
jgi:ribonuclease P/MRP protein subunit POP1